MTGEKKVQKHKTLVSPKAIRKEEKKERRHVDPAMGGERGSQTPEADKEGYDKEALESEKRDRG